MKLVPPHAESALTAKTNSGVKRLGRRKAPPSINFSSLVPDPIYKLITASPKGAELHIHTTGCTPISNIKQLLIRDQFESLLETPQEVLDALDYQKLEAQYRLPGAYHNISSELQEKIQTAFQQARQEGKSLSELMSSDPTLQKLYLEAQEVALPKFVKWYDQTFRFLTDNSASFYSITRDLLRRSQNQNLQYIEPRFDPMGKTNNPEAFVRTLIEGLKDAKTELAETGKKMDYGFIISTRRHHPNPEKILETAQAALDFRQKGLRVVGFDIAGDERHFPITLPKIREAFDLIKAYNQKVSVEQRMGITGHASETSIASPLENLEAVLENIPPSVTTNRLAEYFENWNQGKASLLINWEKYQHLNGVESIAALLLQSWNPETPVRIGHGIHVINGSPALRKAFEAALKDPHWFQKLTPQKHRTLIQSSPMLQFIYEKQIGIEMCPKSNNQNLAASWYTEHPAVFLSRLGFAVSINSDNRTITNTDVNTEYCKLYKHPAPWLKAIHTDRKRIALASLKTAFIHERDQKQILLTDVQNKFSELERDPNHALAFYMEQHHQKQGPNRYQEVIPNRLTLFCLKMARTIQSMFHETHEAISTLTQHER